MYCVSDHATGFLYPFYLMRNIDSLKNTSQFREVYNNGKSAVNGLLVLYALPDNMSGSRLGISVSKKVGNSVVRHRLTRLIRESYLRLKPDIPEGYSIVVVGRVRAKEKTFSDIYDAMKSLVHKVF